MDEKMRTSVYLSPGQVERLQRLAAAFGCVHRRGPGKRLGLGSVSALFAAVADGELVLSRRETDDVQE